MQKVQGSWRKAKGSKLKEEEWEAEDPAERGPFEPSLPGQEIFELEDDMLALVDNPRMMPLLSQVIGEDLTLSSAFLRFNPGGGDPAKKFSGAWHRDTGNYHNNATGRSLALKIFYYFCERPLPPPPSSLLEFPP